MNRTCSFKLVDLGTLKAFVTVTVAGMKINGFKIVQSDDTGPWVSMPSREVERNGKKEYFDIVRFVDKDTRLEFTDWILNAYRRELESGDSEEAGAPARNRSNSGGHSRRTGSRG